MTEDLNIQQADLDAQARQAGRSRSRVSRTAKRRCARRWPRRSRPSSSSRSGSNASGASAELQARLQTRARRARRAATTKGSGGSRRARPVGRHRRRVPVPGPGLVVQRLVRRAALGRSPPPGRRHDGGLRHADLRGRERFGQPQHERPRAATRSGSHGSDGNKYFYAHLQAYVGGAGAVSAGRPDRHASATRATPRGTPHLHFEIHPGGGAAVNPYPTVRAALLAALGPTGSLLRSGTHPTAPRSRIPRGARRARARRPARDAQPMRRVRADRLLRPPAGAGAHGDPRRRARPSRTAAAASTSSSPTCRASSARRPVARRPRRRASSASRPPSIELHWPDGREELIADSTLANLPTLDDAELERTHRARCASSSASSPRSATSCTA